MKAEIPEDDMAHQAITYSELERAKNAITNANQSRVKTDTFANWLRDNKSRLQAALPGETMQDVMEIGLLNSKIGKPEANVFNHSNTFSSAVAQGAQSLGEAKLAALTHGASTGLKSGVQWWNKKRMIEDELNPLSGLKKENQPAQTKTIEIKE
jgi:hypothetical protein